MNSVDSNPDTAAILRRLDVIIQILLESGTNASKTTADKINRLLEFGLSPSETAVVMGKKTSYVTATKAQAAGRAKRT